MECDLCLGNIENCRHVFVDCVFAKQCWILLNQNYGYPIPSSLIMILTFLSDPVIGEKERAMLAYMIFLIWQKRNERLFQAKYSQPIDLLRR